MTVRSLVVIFLITLCIKANATTYYFSSSNGDDSRSAAQAQNPNTPWRTINKLNSYFSYLAPGDNILFKRGDTFYGSIKTSKSGTASAPIVLSSYGSGYKPIITGFSTVTNWSWKSGGIYESDALPAGSDVNMVVINGEQYAMGRYPNVNSANGGYLTYESHGYRSITDNQLPITSSWTGAQVVVRTSHGSLEQATITNISGNTISYSPSFSVTPSNNYGYFVQNDIKALDQFGEWYYNPSTRKISIYFGSNSPSSFNIQVSTIDELFTTQNSNITLDNLCLRGANTYAVYGDWSGVSNLKVTNCKIAFSGIDGIALAGVSNLLVENSTILNSNSNGIDLFYSNSNAVISNTTIKNTATFHGMMQKDIGSRYGMGIYDSQGMTVKNCNIINTGSIGINFTGSGNLIQNNYVDTFCTLLGDGGGIYTYTGSSNTNFYDRKVIGNIVINGIGALAGTYTTDPTYVPVEGIYFDDNATNVEVSGNTVAYCKDAGMYIHNSRGIVIRNNVLYNNFIQLAFQHDALGNGVSGGIIKQNQLFSQAPSQQVLSLRSSMNDFNNFGAFDSNYYCRPLDESDINFTNWFYNKENYYNLSQWQSTYGKDVHTKKTPIAIKDSSAILFQYNATTETKTVYLNGSYVGLDGRNYTSGSVKLAPYTSIILLKSSSTQKTSSTASAIGIADANQVAIDGQLGNPKLTVKAFPNPSSDYFNVTAQGNNTEPMTLKVVDLSGRVLQVKTGITSNSTLQIGQDLMAGYYFLELMQGNKKVEQKVIKLTK